MSTTQDEPETLSIDEANALVVEHQTWAEAIARSVARAWNLDWKLDGLDGAALEALIFCARRFQPARGVPFRGYARKRIHEAATDAARKSRGWRRSAAQMSPADAQSREVAADLLQVFPELRMGEIPYSEEYEEGEDGMRGAVRQMLVGASILAAKHGMSQPAAPDELVDQKKMLAFLLALEPVHQLLLWKIYWEGLSMRSLATEWETDELNVIREHKAVLAYLMKSFSKTKQLVKPKVRPGLKNVALRLKKEQPDGPFTRILELER